MTNSIPYLEKIVEWNDSLMGAPIGVLVFGFCIAAGYAWKIIHVLPNRFIPLIVMLTGSVLFLLMAWREKTGVQGHTRDFVIGFIIGCSAWVAHKLVLKRIEKKLGWFESDDSNPRAFVNPNPPTTDTSNDP